MSARCRVLLSLVFAVTLEIGQAAFATTSYPSYFGPNMSFTGIQETSTSGDPEPLFGAPTGSGDQLLFFPTNFSASVDIVSGPISDATSSRLETQISATSPGATIDILNISESGYAELHDGAFVAFPVMTGTITVLESNGSAITPYVINFSGNIMGTCCNPNPFPWSGSAVVDIASLVPNATEVMLSFENRLRVDYDYGGSAMIQKNAVAIQVIPGQVIPEPGTGLLVAAGLLALAGWRRSH